jgi:ureidoglycolate hydrolase
MRIKKLTHAGIKPYGRIIDASCVDDDGRRNNYGVLLKEPSKGWRIGYLIVRLKYIESLERHTDSPETFEPVKGKIVIALAKPRMPERYELFYLDKPIVVNKGVWHDVLAMSGVSELKIFENIEVKTERYSLSRSIMI